MKLSLFLNINIFTRMFYIIILEDYFCSTDRGWALTRHKQRVKLRRQRREHLKTLTELLS